jgi:ribosomal protein S18 acetylase RimI-like enzyme
LTPTIRAASLADLDRLVEIEERSFSGDKLSKRSLKHLITKGHAIILVIMKDKQVAGDIVVLLHRNTSLARIYSLAIDPSFRRQGLANKLIAEAEKTAAESGSFFMRLEVRIDNNSAITLYRSLGYQDIGRKADYYEDGAEALRMEKRLRTSHPVALNKIPYYEQTLIFTCGPAALLMAMHALNKAIPLDRELEVRLWREATTVFMTSGHGGTTPFGLAIAAKQRGFDVDVFVNGPRPLFENSVRSEDKKAVIALTEKDYLKQMKEEGIGLSEVIPTLDDLRAVVEAGAIPIVLISTWQLYHEKVPHWVVVTGFDDKHIYIHDPWVDAKKVEGAIDRENIPVLLRNFEKMSRYGRDQTRITLIVKRSL